MRWLMIHPGPNFSVADVHNGWAEALRGLGQHVIECNLDRRLTFYDAALIETGAFNDDGYPQVRKALTWEQAQELAANGILSAAMQTWPDVVFATSAFFTPPWVLECLRARRMRIVMLFTEAPYQAGQQLEMAKYADIALLNDPAGIGEYQGAAGHAEYCPHAYRPSVHYPRRPGARYRHDLAFVGTGFPSRIAFFSEMDLDGLGVLLAGHWRDLPEDSPLRAYIGHDLGDCVDNTDTAAIYRRSRAGLNFYRREAHEDSTADGSAMGPREVEMAACGLFFLRDPRPESDEVFPMLPAFTSPGDASDKLRWWLAHDRQRRAAAAQAREAIAGRTFEANARRLLKLLDN